MTMTNADARPATPAQFTHPRLVGIADYLAATRADVVRAAAEVPDALWHRAPVEGGWSPAMIVDHLRAVEHGIVRLMQKVIPEAVAAGHPRETETSPALDAAFIARTSDRSRRIEAPERVRPTRTPDREAGLAALAAERTALLAALVPGDGLALGSLEWVHPVLGTLNLYQWLVFVGAHEARHTAQLGEIAGQ